MNNDWVPQNKDQEFGFQRGKTFVQGFTDQINEQKSEVKRLLEALKVANGLLTQLRKDNRELRIRLVELSNLAEIYCENNAKLAESAHSGTVIRAKEALGLPVDGV